MANGTSPHANRLLWAGFFTIFANGVGFSIRTGVLVHWAREYGFTQTELGQITGGGLAGFGFVIILGSLIADRVGYGRLMVGAFILHILSGILQMGTDPIYNAFGGGEAGRNAVYYTLTVALFLFSIGNGLCEVVVNPMVAALFPHAKTHYLSILHAGWPGGMVVGGVLSYVMNYVVPTHWLIQMSMFLIPVAIYALMMVGQKLPRSEASQAGISFGTMLAEFLAPMLLLLLLIHAMVGYVELGTDSWVNDIVSRFLAEGGVLFFTYTSLLMFALRFFGGPIEKMLSPLGLLFVSAVIATVGLSLYGIAEGVVLFLAASTIYGIGKTFYWPAMLAVVSERFPKGGAVTLGFVGGIGMLSAAYLGAPGIGFKQDYFATKELRATNEAVYGRFAAEKPDHFLFWSVTALDGKKVGLLDLEHKRLESLKKAHEQTDKAEKFQKAADEADREIVKTLEKEKKLEEEKKLETEKRGKLALWWEREKSLVPSGKEGVTYAAADWKPVNDAKLYGGRMAFSLTAFVPATMAVLYLILILYFRARGGYRKIELEKPIPASEQ